MVAIGGLAELTPIFVQAHSVKPAPGVRPYDALRLAGRDVYVREACYQCHSQMIRTLRFEVERYGPYTTVADSVYDRPFQWGSKRTGPDLARIGGKYSDDWHRLHVLRPLGDPYTDAEIEDAPDAVKDRTELDALVAYLQGLGAPPAVPDAE